MGASNTASGSAGARFAPYIEELREFFASTGLKYGSPEDILGLAERIEASLSFADDLSSMVRSIVLRESGELAHSQLLEILALAIGGEELNQAPQQYGQPLRKLLSFMSGVLRKPWNAPPMPGDAVAAGEMGHAHLGDLLEFPGNHRMATGRGYGQAAAISAAAERNAHAVGERPYPLEERRPPEERHYPPFPGSVKPGSMNAHPLHLVPANAPRNRHNETDIGDVPDEDVPDLIGEPTPPERSALDPHIPEDEAVEEPDFSASAAEGYPGGADSTTTTMSSNEAESSMAELESVAENPPDVPEPPQIIPAPSDMPSWQLAADTARGARLEPLVDAAARTGTPPPVHSSHASPVPPPAPRISHLDTEPDIAALTALGPFHEPQPLVQVTEGAGPSEKSSHSHQIPAIPPQYMPRVPRTPAGILVATAALLVLAGIIFATFQPGPTSLTGKQAAVEGPTTAAAGPATGSVAATRSKPTAQEAAVDTTGGAVPQNPSRVHQPATVNDEADADEGDVAAPYSTPIPGQNPATVKPTAYVPSSQRAGSDAAQQPAPIVRAASPPPNEVASASAPQVPGAVGRAYPSESYAGTGAGTQSGLHAGVVSSYRDPDSAIAGDLPAASRGSRPATQEGPNQVEVSSGIMAGYVISAPKPDYPTLARMTHIGGPVVLQAVIAKNGTVLATHVLSGHRLLRGAAEDAVRQWRFRPYMIDGHPVEVSTIVTVRFKKH